MTVTLLITALALEVAKALVLINFKLFILRSNPPGHLLLTVSLLDDIQ